MKANNIEEKNVKGKHKLRNDIILIAAVLLIAAIGLFAWIFFGKSGSRAIVTVDGQSYGSYALDKDTQIEILSEGGTNLLIIRDGKAYVESASCPDLICVHHVPISKAGESIACLPNKTVVSIE